MDMQILRLVADLGEGGEAGTDVEVHVGEEGVLRGMEADRYRGGVAVADLEVDVADCRVKGILIRVQNRIVGRHAVRWRKRNTEWSPAAASPAACGTATRAGEGDHHAHALLKSRTVGRQQEHWPRSAIADQPDPGPQENGPRQAVPAGGHENHSLPRSVDRSLDGGAVVADPVGMRAELGSDQVNGSRVVRQRRE